MKIWLDDIRPAKPGWYHTSSAAELLQFLFPMWDRIEAISFDHDIASYDDHGREITGYTILCMIEEHIARNPGARIPEMTVHSANPVGRAKMQTVIDRLQSL